MAKLNLKSIYTNESTYTVLQLLYKMCDSLDTWDLNNIEFADYKPSNSSITYKLITYSGNKVAVDYANTSNHADTADRATTAMRVDSASHADTADRATTAMRADSASQADTADKATMLAPNSEYQCIWYHTKLTGDKAPVLNHPESELWIYLRDDNTDDSDPVRYWNFIIKIGNLTRYLSKDIASGPNKGKTGVIMRDNLQSLILEAIGSVLPSNFANSDIFVRASAPMLADTKLLRPTFMNEDGNIAKINAIAFNESFINYANGGWSLNGDNNYVVPNTLIITGSAWCTNK